MAPDADGDRATSAPSASTDGVKVPEPFTLVIFGASGDLTRRKLVPAVYDLWCDGLLPPEFAVVGYARSAKTDQEFRADLRTGVEEFSRADATDDVLFYLATPPGSFPAVIASLGESGLARRGAGEGPWSRIIVEKPFGRDLASARDLNAQLLAAFQERQIYRIDHYLGKETVQNILVLRFANSIFDPLWNAKYVDHVQVTVAERVGVEGRGPYYEQAGALRDIVQNHMMHLVCLVAMEPPLALDADAVRDEKVKVLRSVRPMAPACAAANVVRGQYAAGEISGEQVPAYRDEDGVAGDSVIETFVAMRLFIDNWRWAGVPFYLRTGKRMAVRVTEISIHFKPIPQVLFGAPPRGPLQPNVLAVRIQPNDGISMRFQVKVPGPAVKVEPYQMDFGYADAFQRAPQAYERLILDAALGDSTLFTRSDEVEAAWAFIEPILEGCRACPDGCLPTYPAGSWGPAGADALIEADGRKWMLVRRPKK
ncbi:MAG: glucose-6-phosphate dehydrogenase [Planctomycetes bacterium SM23_25]|nr:MAG: glucose-6-phosphate dehydrogenase [Planctomycetes bacterium SM23_25]